MAKLKKVPKRKFVVYEIWTRAKIVESVSEDTAYLENEPTPVSQLCDLQEHSEFVHNLNLSNWHVVPLE